MSEIQEVDVGLLENDACRDWVTATHRDWNRESKWALKGLGQVTGYWRIGAGGDPEVIVWRDPIEGLWRLGIDQVVGDFRYANPLRAKVRAWQIIDQLRRKRAAEAMLMAKG